MLKILFIIIVVLDFSLQLSSSVELENHPPVVRYVVVILMCMLISNVSDASIAGVTYMDKFDFESRYRNHYSCDPLYWHPLHLPDYCASMYAKLISSRLANPYPIHLVQERIRQRNTKYDYEDDQSEEKTYDSFNKLMKVLYPDGKGIRGNPTYAYSNLGPVAVYHQPVSRRNGDMIKKLAQSSTATKDIKERRTKKKRTRKILIQKKKVPLHVLSLPSKGSKPKLQKNNVNIVKNNRTRNKNVKRMKAKSYHLEIPI